METTDADTIFGRSDIDYIVDLIRQYHCHEIPDGYGSWERFATDMECGHWYPTEMGDDVWIQPADLSAEEFVANPRLAITVPWDDLLMPWINTVTGRPELRVAYDWRPAKQEYIRDAVAREVRLGSDITYLGWPDEAERPATGMSVEETQRQNHEILNRRRGLGLRIDGCLSNRDMTIPDPSAKRPKCLVDIATELTDIYAGYPYRLGKMLFVPDAPMRHEVGQSWRIHYLDNVDSLFAWMQMAGRVNWETGVGFVTQKQLYEHLKRSAPQYDAIDYMPHEPPIDKIYYACDRPAPGDGALAGLVDRFCPATEQDRQLIEAMFLTAFWGGPAGSRPAFLITSPFGRGMGKSKLAQMLAYLAGGMIDISSHEDINTIKQRLLTPESLTIRLAVIDNVKSFRLSWAELESLITSDRINGKRMYHGDAHRPNHLMWIMTVNGASLSTDMAQRVVTIELDKPVRSGSWEDETRQYIADHRHEIIGDIIARLRAPMQPIGRATRWATWEAQVLGRLDRPDELQAIIAERQRVADVDTEEADIIHDAIVAELRSRRIDPAGARLFLPSSVLAEWMGHALHERITTTAASRRLGQMIEEGQIANLEKNKTKKRGRGFVWTGEDAQPGQPVGSLDIPVV